MIKASWLFATILALSAAPQASAQQGHGAGDRTERSIAGVCAYAPMPPKQRLEACGVVLSQEGLPAHDRALAHLGRADAYRQTGKYVEGLKEAEAAVAQDPDFGPALLTRAAMHLILEDLDDAIRDASRAIEVNRRSPAGYLLRAEVYLRRGEPAFALGDLDEALQFAPGSARIHLVRAYANIGLGRDEEALGDARAALKLAPEMTAAYLVRAQIHLRTDRYARAAAEAMRAAVIAPDNRMAHDTATIAFSELARFDDAKAAADRLVALEPKSADALNARCWVLALKPDPKAALPDCDAAISLDPKHFQARDSRAFAYWQLGRTEDARADLSSAAEIRPDFWDWSEREGRFATVMIRRYLKSLGFYDGPLDGDFDEPGPTTDAIRAYQEDRGDAVTGVANDALLKRLATDMAAATSQ